MTVKAFDGIHYIALALCFLCGLALTITTCYQIYQNWNAPWLVQRNRYLVVLLTLCPAAFLLIDVPQHILCTIKFGSLWPFEYHLVSSIVQNMSIYGAILGYVTLIFGLYFKHGYAKAIQSENWNLLLQPELFRQNWFVRHKHTFGNQWYAATQLMALWIIWVILMEILFAIQYHFNIQRLGMDNMIIIISACVAIWISHRMWKSFPMIKDAFHIQDSILFTLRWQAAVQCAAIPIGIIRLFYNDLWLTLIVVAAVAFCLFEYCLVIHPLRMMENRAAREPLKSYAKTHWSEIIKDRDGFDAFFCFLQSTFSSESLLFISEYVQFESVLLGHNLHDLIENDKLMIELPDLVPLSSIVRELDEALNGTNDWREPFWITVRQLSTRYIKEGSPLELNIDYNLRNKMNTLISIRGSNDQQIIAVLQTLRAIFNQIYRMLDGAFMHFDRSDIAETYYEKRQTRQCTFIPPLSMSMSLWNSEMDVS